MMLLTGVNLYAQNSDAPDLNLLEFLGEGVKVDNDVIDPVTWQAMEDMTGGNQDKQQSAHSRANDNSQQDRRRQEHE